MALLVHKISSGTLEKAPLPGLAGTIPSESVHWRELGSNLPPSQAPCRLSALDRIPTGKEAKTLPEQNEFKAEAERRKEPYETYRNIRK